MTEKQLKAEKKKKKDELFFKLTGKVKKAWLKIFISAVEEPSEEDLKQVISVLVKTRCVPPTCRRSILIFLSAMTRFHWSCANFQDLGLFQFKI